MSQSNISVRSKLESTLSYYLRNMSPALVDRCPVKIAMHHNGQSYYNTGTQKYGTPEEAIETLIDFYHDMFLTIPNLAEMIQQRDAAEAKSSDDYTKEAQ